MLLPPNESGIEPPHWYFGQYYILEQCDFTNVLAQYSTEYEPSLELQLIPYE